jgi:hypothetical protein
VADRDDHDQLAVFVYLIKDTVPVNAKLSSSAWIVSERLAIPRRHRRLVRQLVANLQDHDLPFEGGVVGQICPRILREFEPKGRYRDCSLGLGSVEYQGRAWRSG